MNFDAWLIIESDNSIGQCPKENIRRKRMVQECHGHVKKVSMQGCRKEELKGRTQFFLRALSCSFFAFFLGDKVSQRLQFIN